MKWSEYDRNRYGVTPPKEPDEEEKLQPIHRSTLHLDPESLQDTLTLLKARLQYARLKITTGMSTEELQHIEQSFLSTPRQPRKPLPEEYPAPSSYQATRYARKIKRALLLGKSAIQKAPGKKTKQQASKKRLLLAGEEEDQEPEQDAETAARTILMLSKETLTPPPSSSESDETKRKKAELLRSPDINHIRYRLPPSDHYRPQTSLFDVVAKIPNYEEISKEVGKSLPRRKNKKKIPPAVISYQNKDTGSPYQYYQYNRPLPTYQYPPPPSTYEHSLPEDPFYSRPIVPNNISNSRYEPPPSPP